MDATGWFNAGWQSCEILVGCHRELDSRIRQLQEWMPTAEAEFKPAP
jgi:hypothetical protein